MTDIIDQNIHNARQQELAQLRAENASLRSRLNVEIRACELALESERKLRAVADVAEKLVAAFGAGDTSIMPWTPLRDALAELKRGTRT